jgi:hypothetical protein
LLRFHCLEFLSHCPESELGFDHNSCCIDGTPTKS